MRNNSGGHTARKRLLSGISAILGVWLVLSPAALGIPGGRLASSSIISGIVIIVLAITRFLWRHTSALSYSAAVVGAWVVMSPWVFDYLTGGFRTWSFVLAGGVIAVIAVLSLTSSAVQHPWTPKDSRST
jgi:hypothetical protein